MASFLDDAAAKRGLDPRALKTLALREQKRKEREAALRKATATRELNSLRARLSVIEREIQRLQVTERRTKSTRAQGQAQLERERRDVLTVSAQLDEALAAHKRIMLAFGKEEGVVARLKSLRSQDASRDTARQLAQLTDRVRQLDADVRAADARRKQLLAELAQAERTVASLEAQRARIMADVAVHERAQAQDVAAQRAALKELETHEASLTRLIQERAAQESSIRQLKASLAREEHEAKEAQEHVSQSAQRHTGSEKGIPSLERDKERIAQQIADLERDIRATS